MSKPLSLVAFVALLAGCSGSDSSSSSDGASGSDGANGLASLLSMNDEPTGTNCTYGGTRITSGIDANSDGILTQDEVDHTEYICSDSSHATTFDGIVYTADKNIDGMNELYANVGGEEIKLAAPARASESIESIQVSPDKTRVAYLQGRQLYSVDLLRRSAPVKMHPELVTGGTVYSNYKWAPDSSKMLYRAIQDTAGVPELYTVLADGSGNIKVNGTLVAGGGVLNGYSWAPDSSKIAYVADQDTDGVNEFYTIMADGSGNVKVNGTLVSGGNVFNGKWAPDSSKIAYVADQDTDGVDELYTVMADGSGNVKVNGTLVSGGNVFNGKWAPDSSKIVYTADQDTDGVDELYTVMADGSGNVKVNGDLVVGGDVSRYSYNWASDSSKIAYTADQDTDEVDELYTAMADGSNNTKVSGNMPSFGDVDNFIIVQP